MLQSLSEDRIWWMGSHSQVSGYDFNHNLSVHKEDCRIRGILSDGCNVATCMWIDIVLVTSCCLRSQN